MPDSSTNRYRRYSDSLWRGLIGVLSGAGNCPTSLDPPRYPKDAQQQDLKRIGQDMYRAFEQYDEKLESAKMTRIRFKRLLYASLQK